MNFYRLLESVEFPFRGEREKLGAHTRDSVPGQYVELPDGVVHYELIGPVDGDVVVLVHGFSVYYNIWDANVDALVQAGFRVLRYDLFGRGYSDRPFAAYNADLFDRQLVHLLDGLNIHHPVALAGSSMGGPVVIHFACRHPDRTKKLILIDPAGFRLPFSASRTIARIPLFGECFYSWKGTDLILQGMESGPRIWRHKDRFLREWRQSMRYKGYKRAILSTLRRGMLDPLLDAYRCVGRQTCPVLVLWGRQDRAVPVENSRLVLEAIPHAQFHVFEDTGHVPHFERPELVNPMLIKFLTDD